MIINKPYKSVRYDEFTEFILFDEFERENIEFIFGEVSGIDGEYFSILYDTPYFNKGHWKKRYVAEKTEIGVWEFDNKQDAVDKLISEFKLSIRYFHHQPIVLAMSVLKKESDLIGKLENWTLTNFRALFNILYWRVEHGFAIEKMVETIKEMIPEDEDEHITKGDFINNLIEKCK